MCLSPEHVLHSVMSVLLALVLVDATWFEQSNECRLLACRKAAKV